MNPKEELAAAILTMTDDDVNQVIALAVQAGLIEEATLCD